MYDILITRQHPQLFVLQNHNRHHQSPHQDPHTHHPPPSLIRRHNRHRWYHPGPRLCRRRISPYTPKRLTSRKVLASQKHTHRLRIRQMNPMQYARCQSCIRRAEWNRQVERRSLAIADGCHARVVVVGVKGEICGGDGEGSEGVDFDIRSAGGF